MTEKPKYRPNRLIIGIIVGLSFLIVFISAFAYGCHMLVQTRDLGWLGLLAILIVMGFVYTWWFKKFILWVEKPPKRKKHSSSHIER